MLHSYVKDLDVRANPFGIQIVNLRCLRCKAWGHAHTDNICPLYAVSKVEDGTEPVDGAFHSARKRLTAVQRRCWRIPWR